MQSDKPTARRLCWVPRLSWKPSDALFNPWHTDENQAGSVLVENGSHLFEAIHLESIGLVHKDQSSRVTDCSLLGLILLNKSRSR